MEAILKKLNSDKTGQVVDGKFGILAESDTSQLKVIAKNKDVAVGDVFVLPSTRGHQRFYIFRTSSYANVMGRMVELSDVARNTLIHKDGYMSNDLNDEKLIELTGTMLGYSEKENGRWVFHRPRRLPDHLSEVYLIVPDGKVSEPDKVDYGTLREEVLRELIGAQLGDDDGIFIGNYLAGEYQLTNVPVHVPAYALSHHLGIFGRTGCGKSNTMMVLIESMFKYNERVEKKGVGNKVSLLAIDPHDEFLGWHEKSGGRGGLDDITSRYSAAERIKLVDPFFYLTSKQIEDNDGMARLRISRADMMPQDVTSIMEFTEQQGMVCEKAFAKYGQQWVTSLISGKFLEDEQESDDGNGSFLESTVQAVMRRLTFLNASQTKVFTRYDEELGLGYDSLLPQIVCALETGRIITIDTTLISEKEQFLLTTIVARVLFELRKALKSSLESKESLQDQIRLAFGINPEQGTSGAEKIVEELLSALDSGDLPYLKNGKPVAVADLPHINFVIEEAPSVLNPERIRFGSVFRDISRQGRKFQIGLTVISQQVTAIDEGILTQINTEFTMALGNETERRASIANASADLFGFEKELQVMGKGQTIMTASYRDVPIPVQAPKFDDMK